MNLKFPKQTIDQLVASGKRQAIVTTGRWQDGRIVARCDAGHLEHEWDPALAQDGNHAAAALALLDQLGWSEANHLVMGNRDGNMYVFVQVPGRHWPIPGLQYAVKDCSGRERVFDMPDEAAGLAVAVAMSGKSDVSIDVLAWTREAAVAYRGGDIYEGGEEYDDDPEASVFERITIKAESIGHVA